MARTSELDVLPKGEVARAQLQQARLEGAANPNVQEPQQLPTQDETYAVLASKSKRNITAAPPRYAALGPQAPNAAESSALEARAAAFEADNATATAPPVQDTYACLTPKSKRNIKPGTAASSGAYAQLSPRSGVPGAVDPDAIPIFNPVHPVPGTAEYVPDYEAIDEAEPMYMSCQGHENVTATVCAKPGRRRSAVGASFYAALLKGTEQGYENDDAAGGGAAAPGGAYAQLVPRSTAPGDAASVFTFNAVRPVPGIEEYVPDYEAIDDVEPTYMTVLTATDQPQVPDLSPGHGIVTPLSASPGSTVLSSFYTSLTPTSSPPVSPAVSPMSTGPQQHGHESPAYDNAEAVGGDHHGPGLDPQPHAVAQPLGDDNYDVPFPPQPKRDTVWDMPTRAGSSDSAVSSATAYDTPVPVTADGSKQSPTWTIAGASSIRSFSKRISRRDGKSLHTPTNATAPSRRQSVFLEAEGHSVFLEADGLDSAMYVPMQVPTGYETPVLMQVQDLARPAGRTLSRDSVGRLRLTPAYTEAPTFLDPAEARRSASYEEVLALIPGNSSIDPIRSASDQIMQPVHPEYEDGAPTSTALYPLASPDAEPGQDSAYTLFQDTRAQAPRPDGLVNPQYAHEARGGGQPIYSDIDAATGDAIYGDIAALESVRSSPQEPTYMATPVVFDGAETDYAADAAAAAAGLLLDAADGRQMDATNYDYGEVVLKVGAPAVAGTDGESLSVDNSGPRMT